MSTVYQIKLLGPVEVTRDDRPVRGFVSRKALALLGYLALQRQPVTRSHLAYLFWGDKSEARGRGNLSRAVSNLAKLLPGCLQADYHSVQFDHASNYKLDTTAFEELLSRDDITDRTTAVELYRDDLMTGLALDDCPEFETWLMMEQEQWRQRVVHLLEKLMRHHTHRHEFEQSLHFSNRLITLAPWHEEGHRQKMLLLIRQGQRGATLTQYESCCRYLREEMGVEPATETTALIERIQTMGPGVHHNLVAQATPFVGRTAEMARIIKLLNDPDCRLLSLAGPGGIGKTRLAIEAARQLSLNKFTDYLDGIYFVALDAVTSVEGIPVAIAYVLNLSLYGANEPRVQLLRYLRDKEMLLVLDNLEQLLPQGTRLLIDILQQASAVKIIVTSRMYLNLRWEWRFPVEGLSVPETGQTEPRIERVSAIRVFENTARRVHLPFTNRPDVIRICRLVEGMPLGIELAASWVGERSCQTIGTEIERNLDSLRTSLQDVSPRHRSMRAVFDYSWGFLTAEEQQGFRRLSVFRGGFQSEAAEYVAAAFPNILSALVDKSLVRQRASERYEIHELLRQYGAEKLATLPGEPNQTKAKHWTYFVRFLRLRDMMQGGEQKRFLAELSIESDNIRAGWQWFIENDSIPTIDPGASALWAFYEIQGLFQEGKTMFEDAAVKLEKKYLQVSGADQNIITTKVEYHLWGQILNKQGWFFLRLGRYTEAQEILQKALSILQQAEPNTQTEIEIGNAYLQLSIVTYYVGKYGAAKFYAQKSLTFSQKVQAHVLIGRSLHLLGLVVQAQGNYAEARQRYREAYDTAQGANDRFQISIVLIYLGSIAYALEEYAQAKDLLQDGINIAKEMGFYFGIALGWYHSGVLAHLTGNYGEARRFLQTSVKHFEEIGERWGMALARGHLGITNVALGDDQEAKVQLMTALKLAMKIETLPVALAALVGIVQLLSMKEKEIRLVVETLTLVRQYPAADFGTKRQAANLLAQLEGQCPPQRVAICLQNSQSQNLEAVVNDVLRSAERQIVRGS